MPERHDELLAEDFFDVLAALQAAGSERNRAVDRAGRMVLRGGVLDAWPAHADAPVRIETDHMLVRGRGANGATQMKHLTLLRDIELVLNPTEHEVPGQETGHVRITCDGPLTFVKENSSVDYAGLK